MLGWEVGPPEPVSLTTRELRQKEEIGIWKRFSLDTESACLRLPAVFSWAVGHATSPPEHGVPGASEHPSGGARRGLGRQPPAGNIAGCPWAAGGLALRSPGCLLRVSPELPVISGAVSWGPEAALWPGATLAGFPCPPVGPG